MGFNARRSSKAVGMVVLASVFASQDGSAQSWEDRVAALPGPGPGQLILTAVGDAIWTRAISSSRDPALQAVAGVSRAADVAFINLEVPLVDRGVPDPGRAAVTRGPTSMVQELVWAGIDLVSIANNHTMDYGRAGLTSTARALEGAELAYGGAGESIDDALRAASVERAGKTVALVSVAMAPRIGPPSGAPATQASPGIAPIRGATVRLTDGRVVTAPWAEDVARMEEAIEAARVASDVVVVSLHVNWLNPIVAEADGEQLVARAAIDAGADMVIGHGPTVLGGVEVYEGRPILYSVGKIVHHVSPEAYEFYPQVQQFVLRMLGDERYPESLMVRAVVGEDGVPVRLDLLPVEITDRGDPRFVEGELADRILERIETLSRPFGTVVRREGWHGVVELLPR